MKGRNSAFVLVGVVLCVGMTSPLGADATFDQFRSAVSLVQQLERKYSDDEANILAPISDRSERHVLVFGNVLCRNFNSPHCPVPTSKHNILVEDPYPEDIEVAVLKGTYYYLRRSTSKNSYGADVPVFVYGTPPDLRKARDRATALARALHDKGIDPATGESIEKTKAREREDARRGAEAKKAAEAEDAKQRVAWAEQRDRVRAQSVESKRTALLFLVEAFPEGCLVDVSAPPAADFQALVRKDLPPELFGYCNYERRVPIEQTVDFCRYLEDKGHKRGANGAFIAERVSTYPCFEGKRCLLSVEATGVGAFPCPPKAAPTPVANPFRTESAAPTVQSPEKPVSKPAEGKAALPRARPPAPNPTGPSEAVSASSATFVETSSFAAPPPARARTAADLAWEKGDWDEAFTLYSKEAETGQAEAEARLGSFYYDGLGRAPDMKTAEEWYRKAANKGNAEALYRLGLLYSDGRKGAPWDLTLAVKWLTQAAETNAAAAVKLGYFYLRGIGVDENVGTARRWYERAAKLGSAEATDWLKQNP